MFTWSEHPVQDLWNHVMFFSNEVNCRKLLNGDLKFRRAFLYNDGPQLDQKVKQITMCISQAKEYFSAANGVSVHTSPLLLFYGMLSLAKALIIANKESLFLEDVKYHGLETRPRTDELRGYSDNPVNWQMEKEYAVTNEGVFKQLAEVVGGSSFEKGSIITFKNLLSVCPEISGMYEKYYNEPSKTFYLNNFEILSKSPYQFAISFNETDEAEIYARFPELQGDVIKTTLLHGVAKCFTSKELEERPSYISIFEPLIGGRYAVSGLKYEVNSIMRKRTVSQILIDYLSLYILSICVRYKQDFWGSIVKGESSGILGLIELYISVVKRRYPNMILNLLTGEPFSYGSPGRFM